ncbi:MAG: hypothetical protein LBQ54_04440 [Planctomycetaceae bacterium]|jgi:predicted Zn-dependent protease|nr:hypothetical protein [Planctomycetaceae bacterium]
MTNELNRKYDAAVLQEIDGDRQGAIESLRQMIAQTPDFALAYTALSAMYNRAGKPEQAVEYAKRYTELEPEDSFGFTVLSSLCIKAGRREEAEDALMNAQQIQMRAYMTPQEKNQE